MPDKKGTSLKARNKNRQTRYKSRKKVKKRLIKKLGSKAKAEAVMKGKDVHKTGGRLVLVSKKDHGKKHGRGNKGPPRVYSRKKGR